jgi:hypothetical protein
MHLQVNGRGRPISKHALHHMQACRLGAQHSGNNEEDISRVATVSGHTYQGGEERFLALTDEGLTVFALPAFALKAQAFRTRGAERFVWSEAQGAVAVYKPPALGKPARCAATLLRFNDSPSHALPAEDTCAGVLSMCKAERLALAHLSC